MKQTYASNQDMDAATKTAPFTITKWTGSLSLAASLLASFSSAQSSVEEDLDFVELEPFVAVGQYLYSDQINALKTPTPINEVPQSLSILTADQIALQGASSIGQLIDYTPGVNTSQGEGHRDAVVFRGSRSTADFYIDGVRDDVQYYRPLYNLEQVEILRGPNALFFGRGGTGGILNRVTKKPVFHNAFNAYHNSIDSEGEYSIAIDSNIAVDENSAYRINAFFESLSNHRDFYDGERIGINPTAKFALSPDSVLDLSYEYIDHQRFIDRGIPTGADGSPVEAFQDIVFGDPELNNSELEAHLLRASLQQTFSESLKGNFSAFYGDYDKLYENFYASDYNQADTPDLVTLDGYIDTTRRTNLVLSANLIGDFQSDAISHTVIVGAEYIDTSSDQDRYNAFWNTTEDDNETFSIARPLNLVGGIGVNAAGDPTSNDYTVDLNDDTRVGIEVLSLYAQDEIALAEQWDLILGARFDSFDIEVESYELEDPSDPSNQTRILVDTRSRKDEEVSPRLGLVYKPQNGLSLYGSYSESFLPRSGEQFANINGNNDALDPNTFSNLEAGLKWEFAPSLNLTASIFEIEQSSPQVADDDPSSLVVIDSQTTGFELQLQGQVTENWFISAGYSYLDGEQVDQSGPTGLRPRELPENMLSVWNTFRATEKLGLGLGIAYQDESFINNGNSAILPSYTRVDAAVYYDVSENLRLQLNVENLTDKLYFPHAHSTHQASVGAPLNAQFSVSGRF